MVLNKFFIGLFLLGLVYLVIPSMDKVFAQEATNGSADITWPAVRTAFKYNIYYKEHGMDTWQYSVINVRIPRTSPMMVYRLNDLKKGISYDYRVGAIKLQKEMVFYDGVVSVQ